MGSIEEEERLGCGDAGWLCKDAVKLTDSILLGFTLPSFVYEPNFQIKDMFYLY